MSRLPWGRKRTTEDVANQEAVAMGSIFSFVLACVVLSHFNVRKESYNLLKMAHDWSKVAPGVFCRLIYVETSGRDQFVEHAQSNRKSANRGLPSNLTNLIG